MKCKLDTIKTVDGIIGGGFQSYGEGFVGLCLDNISGNDLE